jgi:hypothetical protein
MTEDDAYRQFVHGRVKARIADSIADYKERATDWWRGICYWEDEDHPTTYIDAIKDELGSRIMEYDSDLKDDEDGTWEHREDGNEIVDEVLMQLLKEA